MYGSAQEFSEGLALVLTGGRWEYYNNTWLMVDGEYCYIDKEGEIIINPHCSNALSFSEGLAAVRIDGLWGYIDKMGNVVINPQFDYFADDFSEGLASVQIGGMNGKYGYIDKEGNIVINPQFDHAYSFSEGLAKVKIDGKLGYVNKKGKIVWIEK